MKNIYAFLLVFIMYSAWGQDGTLNTSFGNGNNLVVTNAIARESNGSILVGGATTGPAIKRLSTTGTLMSPGINLSGVFGGPYSASGDWSVNAIYVQSNGKILIAGNFVYTVGGVSYPNIIRVDPSGTIDPTFVCNIPTNLSIQVIKEQPVTGKILVGGNTLSSNVKPLYRLHSSSSTGIPGNIDLSFTSAINYTSGVTVNTITTYSGGMIIGGIFNQYSNQTRKNIAKLSEIGSLITDFNVTGLSFTESGVNIESTAIDANNNVLIGGNFTHTPTGRKHLIRVNSYGQIDTNFTSNLLPTNEPGTYLPLVVRDINIQCDGKIIIGGLFYTGTDANAKKGIARLNTDGTNDISFNPGLGITSITGNVKYGINGIIQDPDKQIFICGDFGAYNGIARNGVAKLNISSNLDAVNDTPASITTLGGTAIANVLANDTFGGIAATTSNVTLSQVGITPTPVSGGINLNLTTGAVTVTAGTPAGTYILTYKICPIGNTCISCDTATVTITLTSSIIDAVDNIFGYLGCNGYTLSSVLANDRINGIAIYPSNVNKINITDMTNYPGITIASNGIVNVDASVPAGTYTITYKLSDTYFPSNYDTAILTINILGAIDAVNDIVSVNSGTSNINVLNVLSNDIYDCHPALNTPGAIISLVSSSDPGITLDINTGNISINSTVPPGMYTLTYKICDNVFIPAYSCDTATVTITVLTPTSPSYSVRANDFVTQIETQSNNKIIIAGAFTAYQGQPVNQIARLKADLTYDGSFNSSGAFENDSPSMINALAIYTEGPYKDYIIAAGRFTSISGVAAKNDIVRLTPDGNVDPNFSSGSGVGTTLNPGTEGIYAVAIQPNGDIIIAGNFESYNGQTRKGIARLKSNGVLDPNFNPQAGFTFGNVVSSIALQSDGNIVVSGNFTSYQGQPRNKIVRILGSTGNFDPSFVPANNISGGSLDDFKVLLQPDGNIIFYGKFTNYNGTGKNNIVRLKAIDGTVDPTFTGAGTTTNSKIWAAQIDPLTGYIYVGGAFADMNGISTNYFGRFTSTGGVDNSFIGGYGPSYHIWSLKRQVDGKIILGGFNFNYYNTEIFSPSDYGNITRINPTIVGSQQRTINQVLESEKTSNSNSITIYPNPSEGIFNIDFRGYDEQRFDISIHNTLGQLVYQGSVTPENTNQIDLTRFESGSYFITLLNGSKMINKVVIKK